MARPAARPSDLAKLIPFVLREAEALVIASPEDYERSRVFLQTIARHKRQVGALFAGLAKADALVCGKIKAWRVQQWSTMGEEEQRLAAEAKKQQEEEAVAHSGQG